MNDKNKMSTSSQEDFKEAMTLLETRLNKELGFLWWKKYIAAAFWSNISTPVNLSITVLTALTTAQATTNNLLSPNMYVNISIGTLIISSINTFFRPHDQSTQMIKIMNKYQHFGTIFEEIYYTDNNDLGDYKRRFDAYTKLQIDLNHYKNQDSSPETQNFVSDLIHLIARFIFLRKSEAWLNYLNSDIHHIPSEEPSNVIRSAARSTARLGTNNSSRSEVDLEIA